MKIKQEELSLKGWLIGVIRVLCVICLMFISYACSEVYTILKDLNKNVIELNVNLANVNKIVENNTMNIRSNSDSLHLVDKRVLLLEERGRK
jgi:hypothetical protein